ncbi:hypothetical protein V6N13_083909 [Hibiscus sabdariffa]|uniref:Uncharacterized protein n=1 Tax=Hibiscus sabdariffa TaxID=183260 RepID=A0ABR2T071_9ROSI
MRISRAISGAAISLIILSTLYMLLHVDYDEVTVSIKDRVGIGEIQPKSSWLNDLYELEDDNLDIPYLPQSEHIATSDWILIFEDEE